MVICNFTPDAILWMHGGVDGTLKPGDIYECQDSRGRHILNKFDKRGILRLEFGQDPQTKREEAMEVWRRFWEHQVVYFNQDNERRKNTNKEYVEPTRELHEHAQKLGLELVGPWSIKHTDDSKVQLLKDENDTMRVSIEMLTKQVEALTKLVQSQNRPDELRTVDEKIAIAAKKGAESEGKTESNDEHVKIINEFNKLSRDRFGEWVITNMDRIQSDTFPSAIRTLIKEKWERLIEGPYPLTD